jgi:Na+-transporting NADH:ubiquinone oxidoreductase subunit B
MRLLRKILDKQARLFGHGGPLQKLHPLYEATDTFFYSPDKVTGCAPHVRDAIDLKRMMGIVVFALGPCILMAMYNTGYQANRVFAEGQFHPAGWRAAAIGVLGVGFSPDSVLACFVHGALYLIPVLLVTYAAGGAIEVLFAIVRKHEVNEGFFVTGMLLPLIVPASIPLWQVAMAIIFAVLFAKEVFGGTGMNIFNPALVARAFLFFAYPGQISGDAVWVAVDGYSGPTMLAVAKGMEAGVTAGLPGLLQSNYSWWDCFVGFIPGSMGETSALACLIGAVILLVTRVASWRVMLGVVVGSLAMSLMFNGLAGAVKNPAFGVPFHWHIVLGGWAFGTVFMATDPVSSAYTDVGKLLYGLGIGLMVILIRVVNPAYPEGMMLAILFLNMFAPLFDYYVLRANVKRRLARNAAA